MGKINQGILGGFQNKVGTVVGYFRYGQAIMRGLAGSVSNPRTPAQLAARARFSLIQSFTSPVVGFANVTLRRLANARRMTASNRLYQLINASGAVQGTGTSLTLDYTVIPLSEQVGGGVNPASVAAVVGAGQIVDVTWADNSGVAPWVLASDIVMVCLFNVQKNAATFDVSSATRLDSALSVAYPSLWSGDTVEVYMVTRSADGETTISDTLHVASVTLP